MDTFCELLGYVFSFLGDLLWCISFEGMDGKTIGWVLLWLVMVLVVIGAIAVCVLWF